MADTKLSALTATTTVDTAADYLYIVDGGASRKVLVRYVRDCLAADTTVNFTSGMTAAEMQALIDAQPKNLGGHTLTFQFGDGTYNTSMTSALTFEYFTGGTVYIRGNAGDTTPYDPGTTDPAVTLDFSAGVSGGIAVYYCSRVEVWNMKIKTADVAQSAIAFSDVYAPTVAFVLMEAAGKTALPTGIFFSKCPAVQVSSCWVSNQQFGIQAYLSCVISGANNDYGTPPSYGLRAEGASTIGKTGGAQPNGSTSDESTATGGVIR